METFGGLDIIVNNAGYTWDSVIQKMSDEQFQTMLDVHLVAPFRILRAAAEPIRIMAKKEAEEGREVFRKVVNISSMAGTNGNAGQANYSSAKAALVGLTKTLSKEWGRYKVDVNCVAYGFIDTRLTQSLRSRGRQGQYRWPRLRRRRARSHPPHPADDGAARPRRNAGRGRGRGLSLLHSREQLHQRPGDRRRRRHQYLSENKSLAGP